MPEKSHLLPPTEDISHGILSDFSGQQVEQRRFKVGMFK